MTCAKYRSVALATVALIGLPALAQETQEQSPPDPQTAALLERIEQLEAELADLRGVVLQSTETASKAEAAAQDAVDRIAEVQDQTSPAPSYAVSPGMPDTKWHLASSLKENSNTRRLVMAKRNRNSSTLRSILY